MQIIFTFISDPIGHQARKANAKCKIRIRKLLFKKSQGFWVHSQKPLASKDDRGCNDLFKYLTLDRTLIK